MKQIMHTAPGPVLDEKGRPYPGYSTKSILTYDRNAIKAPPYRIKEWDFYQISNEELCLQFTIGHTSYVGQVSIMLFNFATGEKILYKERLIPLPFGKMGMNSNAENDSVLKYDKGGMYMEFITKDGVRTLKCRCDEVESEIVLNTTMPHSLVINIPFDEKPTQFYYNHKINCMTAKGFVRNGDREYVFDAADSYGILDWGRGVWPFSNEWYWSNGAGQVNGQMFGFNLGCGFGNPSKATENIIFYKGECHKLGHVTFDMDRSDWMSPWTIRDDEGRLELTLYPTYDRTTTAKVLWIDNCTHQMFGEFRGWVVLDDGTRLDIEKVYSFAELAVNNW
ncbi:MAG: DUF2804 domain-containing protein [Oscillospiraceae bacterium]|nr:DUF2804 domain-containing protein [Oscillospiraceae bacterium]